MEKPKPGKKTKLSKPLRVHPDDKPSTYYNESQEVQEISKGVLNRYQGMRRNDHDILDSRRAHPSSTCNGSWSRKLLWGR